MEGSFRIEFHRWPQRQEATAGNNREPQQRKTTRGRNGVTYTIAYILINIYLYIYIYTLVYARALRILAAQHTSSLELSGTDATCAVALPCLPQTQKLHHTSTSHFIVCFCPSSGSTQIFFKRTSAIFREAFEMVPPSSKYLCTADDVHLPILLTSSMSPVAW